MNDNVKSEGVQEELVARKILYNWLNGIIDSAEIIKQEEQSDD